MVMIFSERLKELRTEKGVKQKDVAEFIGISTKGYCFYELGQWSLRCKRFQNYVITLKYLQIILSDVLTAIKLCFNNFLRRHIKQLSENKHLLYIDFPFSALVFEYRPFTYSQHLRDFRGGVFILFPQFP